MFMKVVGWFQPHSRAGDYDGTVTDPVTGEVTRPPSMTKQEFVAECDINTIVREYSITGQIAHINAKAREGAFMDLPDPLDFQSSIHVVMAAEAAFSELPSRVRDRFGNDPERFLQFCSDPANKDEAEKLGLLKSPQGPQAPPAASAPPLGPQTPLPLGGQQTPQKA